MWLLHVRTLQLTEFRENAKRPRYVIASHRWAEDEATFADVNQELNKDKAGYKKVAAFARYVRESMPDIDWLWIDTCCIDKRSTTELSYAINSMFTWYRDAELCIAYLADVETVDEHSFPKSVWFTRGWTLQELLAPRIVVFVTRSWHAIGNKGSAFHNCESSALGPDLTESIADSAGLPAHVLHDYGKSVNIRVEEKMEWMNGRTTTIAEDRSYALFGILGVSPGANYGEGYDGSRQRLVTAIRQRDALDVRQAELYREIADWLSPSDPWTNHESARQRHEPETGSWLLELDEYRAWKAGSSRSLWLYGKAGCGKTILCSTVIEDIRLHCKTRADLGQAVFYFSFSDSRKQSYEDLLTSLVAQLGWKHPGFSLLRQVYEAPNRRIPGRDELQHILRQCVRSYDKIFLHLDGLDECSESEHVRQRVLDGVKELLKHAPNMHMLATSRDEQDIRRLMFGLDAKLISATARVVNPDIQRYVSTQISQSPKLSRLDPATQTLIRNTLTEKADGMFRWVYCQVQELNKSKSTRPKSVQAALLALPATLDEAYERILNNITADDYPYALTLLRWLAYSAQPLTLDQLAEASIVDPTIGPGTEGIVDLDNRGSYEDTLQILKGLVVAVKARKGVGLATLGDDTDWNHIDVDSDRQVNKDDTVRLAHFSVKEFLESGRILASKAKNFHLDLAREHRFLAQSCLVYLTFYSNCTRNRIQQYHITLYHNAHDRRPLLLGYAAKWWTYHASLQQGPSSPHEVNFMLSEDTIHDWLSIHDPDRIERQGSPSDFTTTPPALYYASLEGLDELAKALLDLGADVNAPGGNCCDALLAASYKGHTKVAQILLDAGADIHAVYKRQGNALYAASLQGHEELVRMLIRRGADVNAVADDLEGFDTALIAASNRGFLDIVKILIECGAHIDARSRLYISALEVALLQSWQGIAMILIDEGAGLNDKGIFDEYVLQAASLSGLEDIVAMLLRRGADVNGSGDQYGSAMQNAIQRGHDTIVAMLISHGADVNTNGGGYANALQIAASDGNEDIVATLIKHGADVNANGGKYGSALQAAAINCEDRIVAMLLLNGADVNASGGKYDSALQAAALTGILGIVEMLLQYGADVNASGGQYGSALQVAAMKGYDGIVAMLLQYSADVNVKGGEGGSALQAAAARGRNRIVAMLIRHGANVNVSGGKYGSALRAAAYTRNKEIVHMLLQHGADVHAGGGQFGSALEAALAKGRHTVAKMLREQGAEDRSTKRRRIGE